ncbi:hypothetical protein AVEN_142140-1 [Araneus ventricosus]|uniref:Uncharacterized protein n=1 Tax=Araneus ventricosus TaxID=182803 RepID=A0A4Y2DH80_ARAVE|nr:hypothetical protein AVEN_142140-1 [Araneus ventricosus]
MGGRGMGFGIYTGGSNPHLLISSPSSVFFSFRYQSDITERACLAGVRIRSQSLDLTGTRFRLELTSCCKRMTSRRSLGKLCSVGQP